MKQLHITDNLLHDIEAMCAELNDPHISSTLLWAIFHADEKGVFEMDYDEHDFNFLSGFTSLMLKGVIVANSILGYKDTLVPINTTDFSRCDKQFTITHYKKYVPIVVRVANWVTYTAGPIGMRHNILGEKEGQDVLEAITHNLMSDTAVELSFSGVDFTRITLPFLHNAIGRLYQCFDSDTVKTLLSIGGLDQDDMEIVKRVIDNAKKYYQLMHGKHSSISQWLSGENNDKTN